jgi:tetratricopeptide (TPR) repeat protein
MNPDTAARLDTIVETFIEKRKFAPAADDLLALLKQEPGNAVIRYYLGICHSNLRDRTRALDHLSAIQESPDLSLIQQIQVHMLLGWLQCEGREYQEAEKHFKAALKINPQSSMAFSALGYVYYLLKKYDLAILNFKKAIEEDPNNSGAHNNLGFTFAEIGINVNDAINECRKAIAFNPDSAAYRDSLGWCYFVAGQYDASVKELKKALDLAPGRNEIITDHLNKAMQKLEFEKRKKARRE